MSKLGGMSNLRGGVVYGAARIAPTTARTWALDIGKAGPGHPRYDASDAVALVIMRQLTAEMSIAAGPAAQIVNALRPHLPAAIERIVADQEAAGSWAWDGGPFAIVRRKPLVVHGTPVETWLTIIEGDDPGPAIADQSSGLTPLMIPLRRLINKALLALELVLNGDIPPNDDPQNA